MLFPSVLEAFPAVTKPLEGCVLWPYLDIFGLATTGFGCLIDSVPEFRKPDWYSDASVTPNVQHVDACRTALKSRKKGLHFKQYETATDLNLTQGHAESILNLRAIEFSAYMQSHYFEEWNIWPADAQMAWLLIAWACGPGSPAIFKTAAAASQKRDWATFAKFAKIRVGKPGDADYNPGVVPRNAQIHLCAANALAIDTPGYGTPALYWPGVVRDADTPHAAFAEEQINGYDVTECGLTGSCHLPLVA